jgi:glycosyltransferase 2 family protein
VRNKTEQRATRRPTVEWFRARWRLLAGLALSSLCLYLALREISWAALLDALAVARWSWVALAAAVILASSFLKAIRWRALFLPQKVALSRAWLVFMIGQMLNAVLPARAGEASRIYLIGGEEKVTYATAFSTVVIEKVVDLLLLAAAYLAVAVWLSRAAVGLPDWLRDAGTVLIPVAALGLTGLLLVAQFGHPLWHLIRKALRPLPQLWQETLDKAAGQAIGALKAFQHGQARGQVWVLSLLIWVLMVLPNLLVFEAFGLELGPFVGLLLLVVLLTGVAAPPLPGNVGVFAYLCQLVLSLFGVDRETGLAYGVTLQAAVYLPPILIGSVCLLAQNLPLRGPPRG